MRRATIALVAEKSGYSVATVSRALHNDSSVVPQTREHVLRVCREVGYEPSIAGRRLSWGPARRARRRRRLPVRTAFPSRPITPSDG